MKTRLSLVLLLAAMTAVASPLSAGTKTSFAVAHPVTSVERNSSSTIERGSTLMEVFLGLGAPARKLNADTWLYTGFNGGTAQPSQDDCSLLIVSFKNARVTDLRLVNNRAEQVIAAQLQRKSPPAELLATNN